MIIPPSDAVLNNISQEFIYKEIQDATQGFSASCRLGEGSYGTVFRGTLRDGTEVAIKALNQPKEGGFREEVEVLSRFRHPNLVILLGFARNGRQRCLVYELLSGGDLHSRMQKDSEFTWKPRLSVSLDAALGLSHLHGSQPKVFHRDIKSQNILMDRNGTGKVADFGLALLAQQDQKSMSVSQTSGTIGYADPLYIRSGVVNEQAEIYSFGMVLLEVLTSRPPALQDHRGKIAYQFDHIQGDLQKALAMADSRARWPSGVAQNMGNLALRSTACPDPSGRPVFVEVVTSLRAWLRDETLHRTGILPVARGGVSDPRQVQPRVAPGADGGASWPLGHGLAGGRGGASGSPFAERSNHEHHVRVGSPPIVMARQQSAGAAEHRDRRHSPQPELWVERQQSAGAAEHRDRRHSPRAELWRVDRQQSAGVAEHHDRRAAHRNGNSYAQRESGAAHGAGAQQPVEEPRRPFWENWGFGGGGDQDQAAQAPAAEAAAPREEGGGWSIWNFFGGGESSEREAEAPPAAAPPAAAPAAVHPQAAPVYNPPERRLVPPEEVWRDQHRAQWNAAQQAPPQRRGEARAAGGPQPRPVQILPPAGQQPQQQQQAQQRNHSHSPGNPFAISAERQAQGRGANQAATTAAAAGGGGSRGGSPENSNPELIEQVMAMGFEEDAAIQAAIRCSTVNAAVDWIISQQAGGDE